VRRSIGTTRSLNSRADAAAGGSLGPLGKKPPLPPGKKSRACREEASRLPGRSRRARWGRSLAPAHRLGPSSSPSPAPSLPATWGLCPSPTLSLSGGGPRSSSSPRRATPTAPRRGRLHTPTVAPRHDLLLLDAGAAPTISIRGERDCKCTSL
jgi:hypothetical protein